MKLTQKEIKNYVTLGLATDITHTPLDDIYKMASKFETVGLSFGIYGMNGGLFKDYTPDNLYVITTRNSNLFALA